jgi:Asp-tRNA(Asn)/Glu-tRNA(Gln) amidotransferase A subunit family amidase
MPDYQTGSPLYWPISQLREAYLHRELSPVEVAMEALERAEAFNPELNAYLAITRTLALEQAAAAERAFLDRVAAPLAGVPVSIKDTFDIAGYVSTRGAAVYRDAFAQTDSGCVRRLRAAGAVFVGKTNTAEFGQSATTENRLGDACRNPWDTTRTPGGSSGGASASVAAGTACLGLAADGGGSTRIPAAFTGLVGVKPTHGLCLDEDGFRAMSDFVCAGPLAWRVEDARLMLGVLADRAFVRSTVRRPLRIAWSPRSEGRPVDPQVADAARRVVERLAALGHVVEEIELDFSGWDAAFGPIVLEEEWRERGHLLPRAGELTGYERRTLELASTLAPEAVTAAKTAAQQYKHRIAGFFERYDLIVTPSTAVPAFPIDERPREIDGQRVDWLWGAFPFSPAFNVAGVPAVSLPCQLVRGMPVGVQLAAAHGRDAFLLDVAEEVEAAIAFDASAVRAKWAPAAIGERPA